MSQGSTVKRYPVGIDSFIIVEDDTDNIVAAHINDLADQVKAIETELGTDPAGTETNLKNRLSVSLKDNGYLQENIIYANDLTFTAGSERVRLKTTGEFGIGITPTNLFQVGAGTSSFGGNVGIGTTIPDCVLTINKNTVGSPGTLPSGTTLHFIQADATAGRMIFDAFGQINVFTQRRANGTAASPTQVVANDVLGNIGALGYHTTGYASANKVNIGFLAEETWTATNEGTYMYFQTTASGGTSMSEKMRITGSGNVGIGTTSPQQLFHVGVGTSRFDGDITNKGNVALVTGTKSEGLQLKRTEIQTTNDTQTTLTSLTLEDENTYHLKARVVGVKSDGSQRASYELDATIYRTAAGSATLQGSITIIHSVESDSNWDATITVSGNDARISVTGVAATTIQWVGILDYVNMSN